MVRHVEITLGSLGLQSMTIVWISPSLSTQKAWYLIFSVCSDKHDNLSRDFYFGTVSRLERPQGEDYGTQIRLPIFRAKRVVLVSLPPPRLRDGGLSDREATGFV